MCSISRVFGRGYYCSSRRWLRWRINKPFTTRSVDISKQCISLTQTVPTKSLGHTRILKCVIYCVGIPLSYANSNASSLAHNPLRTCVTHSIAIILAFVLAVQNFDHVPLLTKELLTMDVYFVILTMCRKCIAYMFTCRFYMMHESNKRVHQEISIFNLPETVGLVVAFVEYSDVVIIVVAAVGCAGE